MASEVGVALCYLALHFAWPFKMAFEDGCGFEGINWACTLHGLSRLVMALKPSIGPALCMASGIGACCEALGPMAMSLVASLHAHEDTCRFDT